MTKYGENNGGAIKIIFTVIGIIIGAGLTYVSDFLLTEKQYLEEARMNAYENFLEAHAKG